MTQADLSNPEYRQIIAAHYLTEINRIITVLAKRRDPSTSFSLTFKLDNGTIQFKSDLGRNRDIRVVANNDLKQITLDLVICLGEETNENPYVSICDHNYASNAQDNLSDQYSWRRRQGIDQSDARSGQFTLEEIPLQIPEVETVYQILHAQELAQEKQS